jgi:protein pelota
MKVVHQDAKHQTITLTPETLDDIWYLSNIIQPGDLIRAVTFRTDSSDDADKIRSKKSSKKRMKLGIRVEQVKFHEFSDRLRIHGTIEEGPQDLGSFHTLNITSEDQEKITIVKDEWKQYDLDRIAEAVKQRKQALIVFVSLDDDTATVAMLRQSGLQWISDIDSHRSGKQYASDYSEKEYFASIVSILKTHKNEQTPLVIVGPGFSKDHFATYGKNQHDDLFKGCIVHATGHAGMNGINEALKSGVVEHIAQENRVVFETNLVEKLFQEIKKDGLYSYGINEVTQALENGAVEHLLITDELVRSEKGDHLLHLSQTNRGEFTIINTAHDAGKKLAGIGGVGALLRFKITT